MVILSGAVVLVLGVLGILVTLYPPKGRKAKRRWLTAFGVLLVAAAVIEIVEKVQDRQDAADASQKTDETSKDVAAIREQTSKPPIVTVTVPPAPPTVVLAQPPPTPIVLGLEKTTVEYREDLKRLHITIFLRNYSDRLVAGTARFEFKVDGKDKVEYLRDPTFTMDFPPKDSRFFILDVEIDLKDLQAIRASKVKAYVTMALDYHNGVEEVQYQLAANTYPNAADLDVSKSITVPKPKK
jgi:hypothetical protein